MGKKVIVIGAGFGGLSAAAFLARDGFEVTVLEKNEQAGGRASVYREKGFVFDMGPSWYLMPEVFENFFSQFNKHPNDFYTLKRLDPAYRIFYGPSDYVDISSDLKKNVALFESMEKGSGDQLIQYLRRSEYQYTIALKHFLYRTYNSFFDFFNRKMLFEGQKLHVFESLDTYTKRFFKDEKLRKILEYSMVFLGGAPKNTPAIYSLMSHVDFNLGVWYPDGGIGKVVEALKTLCQSLGVQFFFNHPVEKITTIHKGVSGVITPQTHIKADIVVANADYHHVETNLLSEVEQSYTERYWKKRTIAPSGFVIFLGLNKTYNTFAHHNLFFDHDWIRHFNDIFEKPTWPEFPSYYVSCPSKTDSSVAPSGMENIFILVPVAAGLEDTDSVREAYAEKIISHLEGILHTDIKPFIVVKKIFSHRDFINRYHAYKGTALGLSHTLLQTALFRPKYASKKVKGLYYTGQYTHPGIGMPMCLISAQLVAETIRKNYD